VNMKGTNAGGVQPISQWAGTSSVCGAITSSHSSNVSANTLPALKQGQPLTIFKLCLCPVERKNGAQMAEQVGYASPYRLQHLLGRAIWDEEQMCAEVRDYVVEHLDDGAGIWPWTKPASLKGRRISWGWRQYCGLTGQRELSREVSRRSSARRGRA